jgi:hypothetical protein
MSLPKIVIIPGNGDSHIETDHWYAWVRDELRGRGYEVVAEDMPDPVAAHADIWIPHIEQVLKADANTIVIGHSSGGVATLRFLETHKLLGAIIIGTNYTDMGEEAEKDSGYYNTPWLWEAIKANVGWIVQFISTDDPYIPTVETQLIHKKLNTEYHELTGRGHFMVDQNPLNNTFPEIVDIMDAKSQLFAK